MSFQPEIYPSIGDITKIGVQYTRQNPDGAEYVLATFPISTPSVKIIKATIRMGALVPFAFAQFEISGVFASLVAGTTVRKNDVDIVTNRINVNNKAFFRINGTNVEIVISSGIVDPTNWVAMIAVV